MRDFLGEYRTACLFVLILILLILYFGYKLATDCTKTITDSSKYIHSLRFFLRSITWKQKQRIQGLNLD